MPTQKESHATGVSTYITTRFHRRGTPPCPDQSSHNQKMQNEPNLPPRPPCLMRKTRNEPNFHHRHHPDDQKMRNEPNSTIPGVQPPPVSSKRTQFGVHRKRKTNPISAAPDLWKTKKCETNPISSTTIIPTTKKYETNPISPHRHRPETQICKANPICPTNTVSPPPCQRNEPNFDLAAPPNMRNEPNSRPAHDPNAQIKPYPNYAPPVTPQYATSTSRPHFATPIKLWDRPYRVNYTPRRAVGNPFPK